MIFQALHSLYGRLSENPEVEIAPPGFQYVDFDYAIQLDEDGSFAGFLALADEDGNLRRFLVPEPVKRSSGVAANLLWDKPDYIFFLPKSDDARHQKRADRQCQAFRERIVDLFGEEPADPAVRAVLHFLAVEGVPAVVSEDPLWKDVSEKGRNCCFIYSRDSLPVTSRPQVRQVIANAPKEETGELAQCLVTGEWAVPAELHPAIKNVWGAQSAGANIVSFNLDAFRSYGHKSGDNAPVSTEACFAYVTTLNHLLRKGSRQRMQVGDASTVFWAEHPGNPLETDFAALLNTEEPEQAGGVDEEEAVQPVRDLLRAVHTGALPKEDDDAQFYILGLAPNAARIAIRFWYRDNVNEIRKKIAQHFEDTSIDAGPKRSPHTPLHALLRTTAFGGKRDQVTPNLGGHVMRSILAGTPYPRLLMQQALVRARAERTVPSARAAVFKGCVNRMVKAGTLKGRELAMSLDKSNDQIGYLLGRLFAVCEKAQIEAADKAINVTLRDRFYAAASSTPSTVWPWLDKMYGHHLKKLRRDKVKLAGWLEKWNEEIRQKIPGDPSFRFPSFLRPEEQCLFGVGYYHQKQGFYSGSEDNQNSSTQDEGE